ncbi:hypothetical protein [Leucobacter triazinivorans]|uniref:DUF2127 domain-containing protein n=1 Tax=Leucobacter triazinivorans TaxID=1784719 RepID=A0A4P6KHE2_9MICO|nr:hypothetical protein [Leucobacter triazinivorans]QBE48964.1 hypothetical protein EVS81_09045 [Leucobacter triazinivorans]
MIEQPRKRSAVEPAAALFARDAQPHARASRPSSVAGGAALVVLRAGGAMLWSVGLLREWASIRDELELTTAESAWALGVVLGVEGAWALLLLALAWAVWRGSNGARIFVMIGATTSITVSAIAYFAMGEEITVRTTLVTLALDILVLLALSSRDARAWTRHRANERRARRTRER